MYSKGLVERTLRVINEQSLEVWAIEESIRYQTLTKNIKASSGAVITILKITWYQNQRTWIRDIQIQEGK